MVDINRELERMAQEFEIPEKDVATNWRSAVRSAWGDSIFKKIVYERNKVLVTNTNPRSMKRFPKVARYKCAICGGMFGAADTELDHMVSETAMTKLSHAEDFIKNIFFTSPDKLQILCKDKKRQVNKKKVLVSHGCHSIKTYSERYSTTFEEARVMKEVIHLCKDDKATILKLKELGVTTADIPKTKVAKKKLLTEMMTGEL